MKSNSANSCLSLSSYDADESTNRTTSAVEASKSAELAAPAAPAQPAGDSYTQSYEPPTTEAYAPQSHAPPQPEYGTGYQNGSDAFSGPLNAAPPADQEPQGTGIKEDG